MHYTYVVHYTEAGGDVFVAGKLAVSLAPLSATVKRFYLCYT